MSSRVRSQRPRPCSCSRVSRSASGNSQRKWTTPRANTCLILGNPCACANCTESFGQSLLHQAHGNWYFFLGTRCRSLYMAPSLQITPVGGIRPWAYPQESAQVAHHPTGCLGAASKLSPDCDVKFESVERRLIMAQV